VTVGLSLILPIYRQAGHVEAVIRGFERALETLPVTHETIIVANGRDDGTRAICQRLEAEIPNVKLVVADRAGWGSSVRLGLRLAQGDLICYTNAARTTPATLRLIVDYAIALPGIVLKASRKTRESVWRHLGSLIYNLECRALFDLGNFDVNGTPKVFSREHSKLLELLSDDDMIDAEFLAVCRRENYLVLEVPVIVKRRVGGRSTTTVTSALKLYVGAFRLRGRLRRQPAPADASVH
jgi:glycosyltransferase involved in cell wall biosynthesis